MIHAPGTILLLEEVALTSVNMFVVYRICRQMFFNQALQDSRDNGGMADPSIISWVESCGGYERRFLVGRKSTALHRQASKNLSHLL